MEFNVIKSCDIRVALLKSMQSSYFDHWIYASQIELSFLLYVIAVIKIKKNRWIFIFFFSAMLSCLVKNFLFCLPWRINSLSSILYLDVSLSRTFYESSFTVYKKKGESVGVIDKSTIHNTILELMKLRCVRCIY